MLKRYLRLYTSDTKYISKTGIISLRQPHGIDISSDCSIVALGDIFIYRDWTKMLRSGLTSVSSGKQQSYQSSNTLPQ